jgi:LAGLIDADG DNA endonuclease family
MNLNKKEFLIGTLLGDAHIGRTGLNKAFISFEQSSKKREYLNYLLNVTKEGKKGRREEGEIPLMDENIR